MAQGVELAPAGGAAAASCCAGCCSASPPKSSSIASGSCCGCLGAAAELPLHMGRQAKRSESDFHLGAKWHGRWQGRVLAHACVGPASWSRMQKARSGSCAAHLGARDGETRCRGRRGGVEDRGPPPPPNSAAARRSFSARAAASSSDSARRRADGCGGGAPAAAWLETLPLPAADTEADSLKNVQLRESAQQAHSLKSQAGRRMICRPCDIMATCIKSGSRGHMAHSVWVRCLRPRAGAALAAAERPARGPTARRRPSAVAPAPTAPLQGWRPLLMLHRPGLHLEDSSSTSKAHTALHAHSRSCT